MASRMLVVAVVEGEAAVVVAEGTGLAGRQLAAEWEVVGMGVAVEEEGGRFAGVVVVDEEVADPGMAVAEPVAVVEEVVGMGAAGHITLEGDGQLVVVVVAVDKEVAGMAVAGCMTPS